MSGCKWCRGDGLVFIRYQESEGYDLAACLCPKGQQWRVKYQLRAKAATLDPSPEYFGRLEDFYTAQELKTLTTVHEVYDPAPMPVQK